VLATHRKPPRTIVDPADSILDRARMVVCGAGGKPG
jgi:hypothetical protein